MRPILYSCQFSHHGGYSAYQHLTDFLGDDCTSINVRLASRALQRSPRLLRLWLRLNEYRLLPSYLSGERRCIHYLYPENTLFKGLQWKGHHRLIVSWHQPLPFMAALPTVFADHNRQILEQATGVVFLSSESAREYAEAFPLRRYRVILHGVDVDFFRPSRVGPPRKTLTVLTVGNWLRDHQCWARTVELVLREHPNVEFRVLCSSDNAAQYRQMLGALSDRVTFLEGLSDQDLRALYHDTDIAFLPLTDATANNALVECMACGVPCAVTRLPATVEYAGDTALFFQNSDIGGTVETIGALISSSDLRASLRDAARTRAEAVLSWRLIARQHSAFYAEASSA